MSGLNKVVGCIAFLVSSIWIYADEMSPYSKIRIASEPDYPPYCFVDENGEAAGFSVELFLAAAEAMDIRVEVEIGIWNDIKQELADGSIDALPLVGRTPEREVLFDFTIPYLSLYGGIVIREDTDDIQEFDDLTGKRVAVMRGDNAEEFLRREDREYEIVTTPTFSDALRMLSGGSCDAVVIQRLVGLRIIREEGFGDLRVLDEPIYEFRQDFCFAVREGDKKLLALLNEGLAVVTANGTFRRLHTRWFAAMNLPSRKIRVGGDYNYPPFEFLDEEGNPSGFNTALTHAIAAELGMDVEIYLGPWPKILDMFERGELDVLQGMFYSPERDKRFNFSPPHTVNHCVAVIRTEPGTSIPATLDELIGKQIVVQEGDIMHDYAVENGLEAHLTAVETQEEALRLLSEGVFDCALVGRLTAMYLIEKHGWDNLDVGNVLLASHEYCYAVTHGRKTLLSHFSEGLAVLEDTGEYRRIYGEWLGVYEPLPPGFTKIFWYVIVVVGPLLVVLGIFFVWTRSLRRQVARRTTELRKSEDFQRAIIACSPVALYGIDTEGKVSVWNESAERIFGWSTREIMGKPLPIVPNDKGEEFSRLRDRIMNSGALSGLELIRRKKDGGHVPISLSAAPIRDERGEIIGIIAAAEDITERKRAEEELRKHRDHLKELVEERTKELEKRVSELERFHDATIHRELRMKELRDEVARLKRESGEKQ